jgi:peroxiredoxin Q/BCP
MAHLKPGDKAPAFSLADQHGNTVTLSDFKGRSLVIYFYPKANTPGCTTQSCHVRDAQPTFAERGATVLGVSPDKPAAQLKFDDKYSLGFPLLSDPDHVMAEAYGVWGEKSLYGRKYFGIIRSSFLVDEKGRIAGAWYKVSPADTVPEAMAALAAR